MVAPAHLEFRNAVSATVELHALEAEDDFAAAIDESRSALRALSLLSTLEAHNAQVAGIDDREDRTGALMLAQLNEDLCDAIRAQSAEIIDRAAAAVKEELVVRGISESAHDGCSLVSSNDSLNNESEKKGGALLVGCGKDRPEEQPVWGDKRGELSLAERGSRDVKRHAWGLWKAVNFGSRRTTYARATWCNIFAWTMAFLGLALTSTWQTVSFISSDREPMSARVPSKVEDLKLPELTFCLNPGHSMPSFYDLPNSQFRGVPWLTVRLYQDSSDLGVVEFPNTKGLIHESVVSNGDREVCRRETEALNPMVHTMRTSTNATNGQAADPTCQRCITIGHNEQIAATSRSPQYLDPTDGLRVELVASRVPYRCFYPQARDVNFRVLDDIYKEVYTNIEELVERGILDLNGADPEETIEIRPGSSTRYRKIFFYDQQESNAARPADFEGPDSFACGVYLFSGLWYPTSVKNVSWTYNKTGTGWWEQNNDPGFGPYFNSTSSHDAAARQPELFNFEAPSGAPRGGPVTYTGIPTLNVFIGNASNSLGSNPSSSDGIALLSPGTTTVTRLKKGLDDLDMLQYEAKSWPSIRLEQAVRTAPRSQTAFFRFQLDIAYESRLELIVDESAIYQSTGYAADLANYFGIFTGQSVFALVVGGLSGLIIGWGSEYVEHV